MAFNAPSFAQFVWENYPSLRTALSAQNLEAEEANQAADTRAVVAALDAWLESGNMAMVQNVGDMLVGSGPGTLQLLPAAGSAGLTIISGDPNASQAPSWQPPPGGSALPPQIPLGSVSSTVSVNLGNAPVSWVSATLTGNATFNPSGAPAGGEIYWFFLQDGTGGRTVSIGSTSITLSSTTANTWQLVKSYTLDGLTYLSSTGVSLLPLAPTGGGTALWDARIGTGIDFTYTGTGSSTVVTIPNAATVQVAYASPDNSVDSTKRMKAFDASGFSAWSGRPHRVARHRSYNTDLAKAGGIGQQAHPACAWASAQNLGNYANDPNSNWHVFVGFSLICPDGTMRDDAAFPNPVPSFFQAYEDFGSPFGSPQWALQIRDGANINAGGATLTHGTNYWYLGPGGSLAGTGFPALWVSSSPVAYGDSNGYDFIFEIGRSTAASTDSGVTGGFLRMWLNGTRQTFKSNSAWSLVDSGQTMLVATLGSGDSGAGYTNFDNYWTQNQWSTGAGSGTTPITMYRYPVGTWTTKNAADPTLN